MQVIFWLNIFSDLLLIEKLIQKPINEQIFTFYSTSNALSSSDGFIQIKRFDHHSSIGLI